MQLIDTINNDVSYKFIGTNNEDILCLSDENGLFDFLVDSTYNENSYIFFHKNPKDTLYLKDLKAFEKDEEVVWECRNCGHIVVGTNAPEICPTCAHPQSYFEIHAENY